MLSKLKNLKLITTFKNVETLKRLRFLTYNPNMKNDLIKR
jgi:hypothetical protein